MTTTTGQLMFQLKSRKEIAPLIVIYFESNFYLRAVDKLESVRQQDGEVIRGW